MPQRIRKDRGTELVEFALALSIFFILLLGIVVLGQAFSAYHFVNDSAREATRFAIVRGSTCSRLSGGCPATEDDVRSYVDQIASGTGINVDKLHVTTTWTPNNQPGSTVAVKVTYADSLFFGFLPGATIALSGTSQMVISQ